MSNKQQIAMRSCVICREKINKRDLLRFVCTQQGVIYDPTGKAAGRGAYVCHQPACIERAASGNGLSKALRVDLSEADRQRIREVAL